MVSKSRTIEHLAMLESQFSGPGSPEASRTIMRYYKTFISLPGFDIEFDGSNNIYIWTVNINTDTLHLGDQLRSDLQAYSTKWGKERKLVFEIRFQTSFPSTPPFIRIVQPRFVFRTGHVTIGGSLCTQVLTTSGWNRDYHLDNILMEIISNFEAGGARLHPTTQASYTLAEASEAFSRVARQHGWQ